MTEKQENAFEELVLAVNKMSNKLFGNGSRNGCIDQRLENVENKLNEFLPTMVTKAECGKKHEIQWSKRVLYIGMIATWIGLIGRVMGVI